MDDSTDSEAQVKKRHLKKKLAVGKKYDRNCFFSPVQCMLSFRGHKMVI
jgi:hypothetical protein